MLIMPFTNVWKISKIKRNNILSSFFDEKLFFKSNDFGNKEDVIRFLGQNVIDYGLCEEGFVESVLEREQLSSTCFFDTFAIPHALDMNATHTMICVLTSESVYSGMTMLYILFLCWLFSKMTEKNLWNFIMVLFKLWKNLRK